MTAPLPPVAITPLAQKPARPPGPGLVVTVTAPRPTVTAVPPRQGPIVRVATRSTPAPSPTVAPAPASVARLELPAGDIVAVGRSRAEPVGEGVIQWAVPHDEAGQHDGTPACGEAGNTIIVGHSIWYSERGVFAALNAVQPGQLIRCVNDDGSLYTYRVSRTWESAYADGSWLTQPASGEMLTLYTCRTDLTALVVVQAERVEDELD